MIDSMLSRGFELAQRSHEDINNQWEDHIEYVRSSPSTGARRARRARTARSH
jgi:hypothetical protein